MFLFTTMLSANFATYYDVARGVYPRQTQTLKMLASIRGQFDVVRCYFNGVTKRPEWMPDWVEVTTGEDLTDLGKFYFLQPEADEYYFTLDDDLIYPPNYAHTMVEACNKYNCVVTHHGRKLIGLLPTYYKGHAGVHCLQYNSADVELDVAGTGVMCFNTKMFNPYWLRYSTERLMSDLTFAHEAAKHNIKIMGLAHAGGMFGYLEPELTGTTIHQTMCNNEGVLVKKAHQIYLLKNPVA